MNNEEDEAYVVFAPDLRSGSGQKRNVEMADEADALVAFWDGKSRGTAHMIETAKKNNLKIRIKKY